MKSEFARRLINEIYGERDELDCEGMIGERDEHRLRVELGLSRQTQLAEEIVLRFYRLNIRREFEL